MNQNFPLTKEFQMRAFLIQSMVLFVVAVPMAARGHFVWLNVVESGRNAAQVEVYFAETADPGEPHLISKIAGTKVHGFTSASGAPQEISLKEVRDELSAKLTGSAPQGKSYCLEAVCDYGVVAKGGQPFLLQYYAKHIKSDSADSLPQFNDSNRLPLDTQLAFTPQGLTCTVVWKNKPLANAEVVIQLADGNQLDRKTNERGQVDVTVKEKGSFSIRTRHVEAGKSGTHNGKDYAEVRHYATLTCSLAAESVKPADPASLTAASLLQSAREARAVWNGFPGFSADLAVRYNDEIAKGKVVINADGEVALKMPEFSGSKWLQTYLESMVQHRMPGDPESEQVRYVDRDAHHPLGPSIALGDGDQDSVYRVADNVVREVNRKTGRGRFTISVLDVERNAEGKYLPTIYTMTFWNGEGKVDSTHTTHDAWVRVGQFDLPLRTMQVTATDERRDVKLLEFSNHALEKTAKSPD
jgi:hypothetical protein